MRGRRIGPLLLATIAAACGGAIDEGDPDAPAPDAYVVDASSATDTAAALETAPALDSASSDEAPPGPDLTPPTFRGCTGVLEKDLLSFTLIWSPATDDRTPAEDIVYDLYVSDTSKFETFSTPSLSVVGVTTAVVKIPTRVCRRVPFFVCRARDAAGNRDDNTFEVWPSTTADLKPPCFDGLASVGAITASSVELSWKAATDARASSAELRYRVFAGASPGVATTKPAILVTPPGVTSVVVTGLAPHTEVCFVVRAENPAGNVDDNVVERCVTTL